MDKAEAGKKIAKLTKLIREHDRKYFVENKPEISDEVYDQLFKRLQELEAEFPELASENSPTKRVGAEPLDELTRVDHVAPMLSLNAVFESDEVESFIETVPAANSSPPAMTAMRAFRLSA